jgi:DNA-binding GntR family transcriptional regulator
VYRSSSLNMRTVPSRQAERPALGSEGSWSDLDSWSPGLQKAQVYESILLDVILGVFPPEARLDEHGLAERYGVGLAGVREALGRMALEGLVARKARAGTTIAPIDRKEMRQIFEVRRRIEPYCATLAAENATEENIAALRRTVDGADEAIADSDFRTLVLMDLRFHAQIARSSENCTLARILIPLQHKAARFWAYTLRRTSTGLSTADFGEHRAVMEAIACRDGVAAHAAVLRVLGEGSRDLAGVLALSTARDPEPV